MRKITGNVFLWTMGSLLFGITACQQKKEYNGPFLFEVLNSDQTNLKFSNNLKPTPEFNMLKYMYYYNGAGAAAADFNRDGKTDLFFCSNQGQNTLYLNEGNMQFKDVTQQARIPVDSSWSTGVSVVDINNDSLPDLYICRVGKFKTLNGKNQLLVCKAIQNGIPVYADETELYGLGFSGFSTQSAFFDFDGDGDLDMFLMNHSVNHNGNFAPRANFLNTYDSLAGDQFFRNDNNHFTNITRLCGINSSRISYGLGIAISDINLDGWPDIYIGNDFHENDYLYINQRNGTFREELKDHVMHTSQFSMGVDIADINNDIYPDIVSMDMLPYDPAILKRSLGEDQYQTSIEKRKYGYYNQYARNNLQLNQRDGMFAETGFYSGIYATDWSWSSLWMDFDNDGNKDLFISNGIPKRLNDIDYINYMVNDVMQEKIQGQNLDEADMAMIDKFPQIKLPNKFFINTGNAKFKDAGIQVKDNPESYSNGALYADLDNDGDLDIVVNNIWSPVLLYRNNSAAGNAYINLDLKGSEKNVQAIGTKCFVFTKDEAIYYEKYPVHGFMSSMEMPLHIGLGTKKIDSIIVVWPDNTCQPVTPEQGKHSYQLTWKKGLPVFNYASVRNFIKPLARPMADITATTGISYIHEENDFNEFNRELLLPKMFGSEGPALAVADVNGDGLDDIFAGSSKWKQSALYLQTAKGTFIRSAQPAIASDSTYEDVDACFADINNDKYPDLLVASGGNEFFEQEDWRKPRVYLNDGKGNFSKEAGAFPPVYQTQSCIKPCDFNHDGYVDVFIGGRTVPFQYGKIPGSYLLQNDGRGHFTDVTNALAPGLQDIGFVTNAAWADVNQDKQADLIVSLEWGAIQAFIFSNGKFTSRQISKEKGWWNFVLPADIDGDGDIDLIAGNQGQNSIFQPTAAEPIRMYYNDFDDNGTKEQLVTYYQQGIEIPMATKMDLEKQMPFIKKKYLYAGDFSKASLADIFSFKKLNSATLFTADYFSNAVLINDGAGNFTTRALPWQAQLSCLKDGAVIDANADGLPDILTGGNFYEQAMPLNRNDADFGTILINKGRGDFKAERINGLVIKNQVRHISPILINKKKAYVIARNNDSLMVIQ